MITILYITCMYMYLLSVCTVYSIVIMLFYQWYYLYLYTAISGMVWYDYCFYQPLKFIKHANEQFTICRAINMSLFDTLPL